MVTAHCATTPELERLIYGVHMPAFIFISGYLFKYKGDYARCLRTMGIPILLYVALFWAYILPLLAWKGMGVPDNLLQQVFTPFFFFEAKAGGRCFNGMWFVMSLLILRLLFTNRWIYRHRYPIAVGCAMVWAVKTFFSEYLDLGIYNHLYIVRVISLIPFYAFGMWLKEHQLWKRITWPLALLCVVVYGVAVFLNGGVSMYSDTYGKGYLLSFAISIVGFLALYKFCNIPVFVRYRQVFEIFGMGTFFILGTHITIKDILVWKRPTFNFNTAFAVALVIMLISYYPIKVLARKYPILLGKAK